MGNCINKKNIYAVNTDCIGETGKPEEEPCQELSEEDFRKRFEEFEPDGEIDAYQLSAFLKTFFLTDTGTDGLGVEVCRSLVAAEDTEMTGRIGVEETWRLYQRLTQWKKVYEDSLKSKDGKLEAENLATILNSLGAKELPERTVKAIAVRYKDRRGHITFPDFAACITRLATLTEIFQDKQNENDEAEFAVDEFIQMTVYT